jgi:hypothetical protein
MMRVMVLVAALAGCGATPAIMEMRMQQLPARERDCALAWLPQVPDDVRVAGTITIVRDVPERDPIGAKARAVIAPRACAMGGSAVALFTQSIVDGRPIAATYMVLTKRSDAAESPGSPLIR